MSSIKGNNKRRSQDKVAREVSAIHHKYSQGELHLPSFSGLLKIIRCVTQQTFHSEVRDYC